MKAAVALFWELRTTCCILQIIYTILTQIKFVKKLIVNSKLLINCKFKTISMNQSKTRPQQVTPPYWGTHPE